MHTCNCVGICICRYVRNVNLRTIDETASMRISYMKTLYVHVCNHMCMHACVYVYVAVVGCTYMYRVIHTCYIAQSNRVGVLMCSGYIHVHASCQEGLNNVL